MGIWRFRKNSTCLFKVVKSGFITREVDDAFPCKAGLSCGGEGTPMSALCSLSRAAVLVWQNEVMRGQMYDSARGGQA